MELQEKAISLSLKLKPKLGKVKSYDPITRFHHKIQWYHKKPGLIVEFLWAFMMVITIIKSQTV